MIFLPIENVGRKITSREQPVSALHSRLKKKKVYYTRLRTINERTKINLRTKNYPNRLPWDTQNDFSEMTIKKNEKEPFGEMNFQKNLHNAEKKQYRSSDVG